MATQTAEQLLTLAQTRARKLTIGERRTVIAYLEDTGEDHVSYSSNYKLAELFGVDEKVIRDDKKKLLQEYAQHITPEYAMGFVAAYLRAHDDLLRRTRHGLSKAVPGSLGHQNYLRLLSDLETKRMKLLQEIGAVPRELGHMQISEERWIATVSEDGVTSVHQEPVGNNSASSTSTTTTIN
jgi:hypothetical protein